MADEDAQEEEESEPVTSEFLLSLLKAAVAEQHEQQQDRDSGDAAARGSVAKAQALEEPSESPSLASEEEGADSGRAKGVAEIRPTESDVGEGVGMEGEGWDGGEGDGEYEYVDGAVWARETTDKIVLSLCGRDFWPGQTLQEQRQMFLQQRLSMKKLLAYPGDLSGSPDLCVSVRGSIYRWQVLAPALMCALCFGGNMPLQAHHQLLEAFPMDRRFQGQKPDAGLDDEDGTDLLGLEDTSEELLEGGNEPKAGKNGAKKYLRKTLVPSPEQLRSLPLRPGANTIRFYLSLKASVEPVTASIFLWTSNARVVISDVDGTITKSDALGHLLPRVGIQWAQKGVPQLLDRVNKNGYRVLYLTARPIGQVDTTKAYLQNVKEDGVHLPLGPVITSPDGLFKSLNREIVQRKPEEFKIECLKNLQKLFGPKPFYAGFGNKPTDAVSYRAVDVPDSRILIINPHGEIHNELNQAYTTSYDGLRELVDLMFPFVKAGTEEAEEDDKTEDFSMHNFWKLPGLAQMEPSQAPPSPTKK